MSQSSTFPFGPKTQFLDANGDLLVGGLLNVYSAGTTTPSSSYSESTLTTANANPIVLDARGECDLFLANGSYKFVLTDSAAATIWTSDNITVEDFSATSTLLQKYTVEFGDLTAAATTVTSTLFSLPAKTVIEYIVIKHSVAFAGTSITALTVDIGDSGDDDSLVVDFDLMATVAETASEISSVVYMGAFASATDIIMSALAVGANLDQLTAGSVDVWVKTKGMN